MMMQGSVWHFYQCKSKSLLYQRHCLELWSSKGALKHDLLAFSRSPTPTKEEEGSVVLKLTDSCTVPARILDSRYLPLLFNY